MSTYSFQKGWEMLRVMDQETVKNEIKYALAIKADQSFTRRRRGKTIHSPAEIEMIEKIFERYGVARENVWGETCKHNK